MVLIPKWLKQSKLLKCYPRVDEFAPPHPGSTNDPTKKYCENTPYGISIQYQKIGTSAFDFKHKDKMSSSNHDDSRGKMDAKEYAKKIISEVTAKARLVVSQEQKEKLKQPQQPTTVPNNNIKIGNEYDEGGHAEHVKVIQDKIKTGDPYAGEEGVVDYYSEDEHTTTSCMTGSDGSELHSVGTYVSDTETDSHLSEDSDYDDDSDKNPVDY